MKIGFSLGQCVRDIVKGKVNIDHVAFIVTQTLIKEKDQLDHVIMSYLDRRDYLAGLDEEECLIAAHLLWDSGRLIQPRMSGVHQPFRPFETVWCDIAPSYDNANPAVMKAWEQYLTVANLAGERI